MVTDYNCTSTNMNNNYSDTTASNDYYLYENSTQTTNDNRQEIKEIEEYYFNLEFDNWIEILIIIVLIKIIVKLYKIYYRNKAPGNFKHKY